MDKVVVRSATSHLCVLLYCLLFYVLTGIISCSLRSDVTLHVVRAYGGVEVLALLSKPRW
jgi:hypothetical protein